jgi:hypothetical protein
MMLCVLCCDCGSDRVDDAPAHDLPGPGPEEVFPRHRGEGCLDPRVADATGCHNLLRKGAPDDFQFGFAIHLDCMAGDPVDAQNNMAGAIGSRTRRWSWRCAGALTQF